MILSLVTPPSVEPITLAEAKAHIRLEVSVDDAYVTALITAAREYVEKVAWRGLISQTWKLTMEGFPVGDVIELPKGNLITVTQVQYLDVNHILTVLPASVYEVDTDSVPGNLRLKPDQAWPATDGRWNSVQVEYTVGFGATAASVPEPVKHVIKLLVSQMYEHRTPEVTGTIASQIKFSMDALLYPYRLMRFA